jgi:hypothetical protein
MPSQNTRVMTGFQDPTPMKSLVKVCIRRHDVPAHPGHHENCCIWIQRGPFD